MESNKKEKLNLSKEEAQDIIYDGNSDYQVIEDTIEDTSRWSEHHRIVILRKLDNKYFADYYSKGLTEMQDEQPYEYNDPNFTQVFPEQITITVYK